MKGGIKTLLLNLSQQTDDVGMRPGFNESQIPLPLNISMRQSFCKSLRCAMKSFLLRLVPVCGDIWPDIMCVLCCPDDVKVDFAPGLCLMSRSIHDSPRILWPRPDVRPRVTNVSGLVTGPGWYQASGCLQPVKLCWECLQRISSLFALSQCLLYNY